MVTCEAAARRPAPANPNGAAMPKNSGVPVLLPVYPQGTLLVQVFWDVDGDGQYDSDEPLLSSGTATVGGQTKSYSENGAVFVLAQGTTSLTVVAPAGYQISASLPITVVVGAGTTTRVPARVAGGINGAVIGPEGALAGLTVRLTNIATNQTSRHGRHRLRRLVQRRFLPVPQPARRPVPPVDPDPAARARPDQRAAGHLYRRAERAAKPDAQPAGLPQRGGLPGRQYQRPAGYRRSRPPAATP